MGLSSGSLRAMSLSHASMCSWENISHLESLKEKRGGQHAAVMKPKSALHCTVGWASRLAAYEPMAEREREHHSRNVLPPHLLDPQVVISLRSFLRLNNQYDLLAALQLPYS